MPLVMDAINITGKMTCCSTRSLSVLVGHLTHSFCMTEQAMFWHGMRTVKLSKENVHGLSELHPTYYILYPITDPRLND